MIEINLIGGQAKSNSSQAYSLEKSGNFGKKENQVIIYSHFETLYLK